MASKEKIRLLILNQMAGPMTRELAEDLSTSVGPVALLTGHPETLGKGNSDGVTLVAATPYRRGNSFERIISWLQYSVHAFWWLWQYPSSTPVLLFSNPPFLCWIGYVVKKLRRQSYIVVVHDIYPDLLIRLRGISAKHLLIRLWMSFNRRSYRHATALATLGHYMAVNLRNQLNLEASNDEAVKLIYPWVDTNKIFPIPKAKNWFAKMHEQEDKLTVMYSGNMGIGHDIETILITAKSLKMILDIHFILIGSGPKWNYATQFVQENELRNVTVLPWQAEDVIPYSLSTADISVVSIEPGVEGLMIPSKAIYSMAAGTALVALVSGTSELSDWIEQYRCGFVIRPGDVDSMSEVLLKCYRDADWLETLQHNSRLAAIQQFSRESNVPKLEALLQFSKTSNHRIVQDL